MKTAIKVGDSVKLPFAKKSIHGTVIKLFDKTVYIAADLNKQKGVVIKRKRHQLSD